MLNAQNKEFEIDAVRYSHIFLPCNVILIAMLGLNFLKTFADSQYSLGDVDLLIGSDYMWYFFTGQLIRSDTWPGLVAIETVFGWVLVGPSLGSSNISPQGTNVTTANVTTNALRVEAQVQPTDTLNDEIKHFWDIGHSWRQRETIFRNIYQFN